MTPAIVLAADLGGTTTKAALVASDGAVRAEAAVPAPAADPDGLIPPQGWWDGFIEAARELQRHDPVAFGEVVAIAVTGVTRTPVVLDAAGEPLCRAITARDVRAQAIAAETPIDPAQCPEAARYDAFHPAARLKWLVSRDPRALDRAAAVVDPKDFIAARLTGRIASDAISLARQIAAADSSHGPSLLARLGLPQSIVPELIAPTRHMGVVRANLPAPLDQLAGRPVVMTAHDTWSGVVGLGALVAGRAYNVSGTTETFGVMGSHPVTAEGLMDVQWGALHQIGGPGQNGADVLAWLATILHSGRPDAAAQRAVDVEAALSAPRRAAPLLFLPFLAGERVPFWDADLRAAFLGLSREHGPADMAWAVLEGIAFLNRIVLTRAEAAAGLAVDQVRLGGGAARSAVWAQVKADILERPVATVEAEEPGVFGASLAAFVALGTFDTLDAAQQLMVRVARRYEPRPRTRDFYRALGLLFADAHAAIRPLSHQLARLTVP